MVAEALVVLECSDDTFPQVQPVGTTLSCTHTHERCTNVALGPRGSASFPQGKILRIRILVGSLSQFFSSTFQALFASEDEQHVSDFGQPFSGQQTSPVANVGDIAVMQLGSGRPERSPARSTRPDTQSPP